ncbi:MAG: hypothetical protein R3D67_02940 [Hyphomicrobiaceae bacterium]
MSRLVLLLLSIVSLVYASDPLGAQNPTPSPAETADEAKLEADRGGNGLPQPAADMREAILEAVRTGKLEDLRIAIELNEIRPAIGESDHGDALEGLKALAKQNPDTDLLVVLGKLLNSRWIAVPLGPDPENNRVYVWPRFAETGLKDLDARGKEELKRIVPEPELKSMLERGVYDFWRVGIGADGTWHFLRK